MSKTSEVLEDREELKACLKSTIQCYNVHVIPVLAYCDFRSQKEIKTAAGDAVCLISTNS